MRLHCLGTAGYHPNRHRHTSCYFLPSAGILLDAGTGVYRLAPLIQTETLDILISHAHLDHTAGLTFLLDVLFERPVAQLRIWGEQAKLDAIRTHLFDDLIFPVPLNAQWNAIDALTEIEINDITVTYRYQEHPGGSVGYRLDWPGSADPQRGAKRLLYVTDTVGDTSDEAIAWYSDADLLMHECYFQDCKQEWALKTGHSWTSRVAEIARAAAPAKLMLTHVNPLEPSPADAKPGTESGVEIEQIRAAVDAEVLIAQDGIVVDF